MNEEEKWAYIGRLDEELLKGGVILSEWSTFLIKDSDIAFAKGANLAALLTAMAGIESHLKHEYGEEKKEKLVELIDKASIEENLKADLHKLRKFRNKWVHVLKPNNDEELLASPDKYEKELEEMALLAIKSLRRTIYTEQWI